MPLRGISDRRVVLGHLDDVLYRLTWFPIAGRPVFRLLAEFAGGDWEDWFVAEARAALGRMPRASNAPAA